MVHLIDKRKRIKNTSYISPKFNFLQFCPVLPSFTQFYPVLPSFAQFYPVLNGFAEFFFQFHSIPPNFAQFYPVFPGFLQFCPVLPSFAQFCPVFSQFFQVFLPIFITSKISISSRARRKNNGTTHIHKSTNCTFKHSMPYDLHLGVTVALRKFLL